jgi:hypothetical protein
MCRVVKRGGYTLMELNERRVGALTAGLYEAINGRLKAIDGPVAVFEVLQALALTTATVLRGAGEDAAALREWVDGAIDQAIAELAALEREGRV